MKVIGKRVSKFTTKYEAEEEPYIGSTSKLSKREEVFKLYSLTDQLRIMSEAVISGDNTDLVSMRDNINGVIGG